MSTTPAPDPLGEFCDACRVPCRASEVVKVDTGAGECTACPRCRGVAQPIEIDDCAESA